MVVRRAIRGIAIALVAVPISWPVWAADNTPGPASGPSFAPLGYLNSRRTIVPDPVIAPIIRSLFEWYATGEHSWPT